MSGAGDGVHVAPPGFTSKSLPAMGHGAELPAPARSGSWGSTCRVGARPYPPVPPAFPCSPASKPRNSDYLIKDLISCISQLQSDRLDSWKSRNPAEARAALQVLGK